MRLRRILRLALWIVFAVSAVGLLFLVLVEGREADLVLPLVVVSVGVGTALVLLGIREALDQKPNANGSLPVDSDSPDLLI